MYVHCPYASTWSKRPMKQNPVISPPLPVDHLFFQYPHHWNDQSLLFHHQLFNSAARIFATRSTFNANDCGPRRLRRENDYRCNVILSCPGNSEVSLQFMDLKRHMVRVCLMEYRKGPNPASEQQTSLACLLWVWVFWYCRNCRNRRWSVVATKTDRDAVLE